MLIIKLTAMAGYPMDDRESFHFDGRPHLLRRSFKIVPGYNFYITQQ